MLRFVCLVEPDGATLYQESLYTFRAEDFENAFRRVIEIGKSKEREYYNAEHQRVVWRFKEIVTIDIMSADTLDGAEVYSKFVDLVPGEAIPFDAEFHPEQSKPTQTI